MKVSAFLCVFLLGLFPLAGAAGSGEPRTLGPREEDLLLELAAPVRRGLSAKQAHRYRLELASGEFVHFDVKQIGIDVSVSLLSPEGRKLIEIDTPSGRFGTEELVWIPETAGTYGLVVSALDESATDGAYEVRLRERRPHTPGDRTRLRAQAAFAEGYALSQKEETDAQRRAVETFEASIPLWRKVGDRKYEAMTLARMAYSYHNYLGEPAMAAALYETVLPFWRETDELQLEAFALFGLATAEWRMNSLQKALDYYGAALAPARCLGDRSTEAQILSNLAMVHNARNDKAKALEFYGQALPLLRETGNRYAEQYTLTNIGLLYDESGEKQKALDAYRQSLALCRDLGVRKAEAVVLSNIGRIYIDMGEEKTGREHLRRSLEISRALGDLQGEALALMNLAQSEADQEMSAEALTTYEKALVLFRERRDRRFEGVILNRLSELYEARGDAGHALRLAEEALLLARETANRYTEGRALTSIAVASASLGNEERAVGSLVEAEALLKAIGDRFYLARACYELARVERRRGDLEPALAHARTAVGLVESLRTEVISHDLRASFFGTVQRYHALAIDLLMQLHKKAPHAGYDVMALHASEQARARAFLDMLAEAHAEIHQGVDPRLLQEEGELRRQIGARVDVQVRRQAGSRAGEVAPPAQPDLESLRARYQQLQEQIREGSPRYAALTQPRTADLADIQRQLGDDTLLLEFWLGEERGFCWTVGLDSLATRELPAREKVEAAARGLYDLLTARNRRVKSETAERRQARVARADAAIPKAAASLRQMLLPPPASIGRKRLLIVADGALQFVPFGVLPIGGSATPLGVDHEIVTLPSATALSALREDLVGRKPAPKMLAVLADPVFDEKDARVRGASAKSGSASPSTGAFLDVLRSADETGVLDERGRLQRLRFSREEARSILRLVLPEERKEALDFDANLETAKSPDLGQYRFVHFATHGVLNTQQPELSGVILSLVDREGKSTPGFLAAADVFNLKLPAELVVLSGCQTALGKEVKGEGLVGLTRGFFYAGAARVVSSLWKVDDVATAELMARFYEGMLGTARLRPAAALREAQEAMWKKRWHRAPYYWAAFVLQGEWR
jgi:CHAT domain-containing protein